jgi:hypothetical protein
LFAAWGIRFGRNFEWYGVANHVRVNANLKQNVGVYLKTIFEVPKKGATYSSVVDLHCGFQAHDVFGTVRDQNQSRVAEYFMNGKLDLFVGLAVQD